MRQIELTQGKVAIVDDEDYDDLMQYKWCAVLYGKHWYAARRGKEGERDRILMHNHLFNDIGIDHINGDGLDNRRINLRSATRSQNLMNQRPRKGASSKYKGVSWAASNKKWKATLTLNSQLIHLGYYLDEEDAARAYDEAALKYFGEFARPNFKETNA